MKKSFVIFAICFVGIVSALFTGNFFANAESPAIGWQTVASSADGTKLAAGTWCGGIFTSTDSGVTWVNQGTTGNHCYRSIASSADGTKLAAVDSNYGYIYTSTDSGNTWAEQTDPSAHHNWFNIASDSTGNNLVVVENTGDIFTSANGGSTWTRHIISGGHHNWYSVASSADGTHLAVGGDGYYVYTSSNSGTTWTQQTTLGQHSWYGLAISSDGTTIVAADGNNGYIYTSTDSGTSWSDGSSSPQGNWFNVALSADGMKLAASMYNGYIYTSTDGGANWSNNSNSSGTKVWTAIASDSTGDKLVATSNGKIVTSTDAGLNWSDNPLSLGNMTVTVKDENGSTVSGAQVEVACNGSWTVYGTTDGDGIISGVPPVDSACPDASTIRFRISKTGYLTATTSDSGSFQRVYFTGAENNFSLFFNTLDVSNTTTNYIAQFWNNNNHSSSWSPEFSATSPDLETTTQVISADWSNGSPESAITVDGFLARYYKTAHFDAGNYYFGTSSDDGSRIYLDGALIMDGWTNGGGNTTVDVSAGDHTVTVEYFEATGTARLAFEYYLSETPDNSPDNVYESSDTSVSPSVPGTEGDSINTNSDDGSYLITSTSNQLNGYDSQVYKFTPNFTGITNPQFDVSWIGHGSASLSKDVYLSIWNFTNSAWDSITSDHCGTDCTLSGHKTGNEYKDGDGIAWVWAKADSTYGPPTISNVTAHGGLLPIAWDTDADATSMVAYDTSSHTDWADYNYHISDGSFVSSHTLSPQLSSGNSQQWSDFATSSDGSIAVATTYCGYLWQTIDSGHTWTQNSAVGSDCWGSVAMSSDGQVIAVGKRYGEAIRISTDGGTTWSTNGDSSGSGSWWGIAMSSDGTKIAAVDQNWGYIHVSTDTGVTWSTNGDSSGSHVWSSIDSDATGMKLVAGDLNYGYVYTSQDGGVTWTTNTDSSNIGRWYGVASSSDGGVLIAADNDFGFLIKSTDGGVSWTELASAGRSYWKTVSVSADGSKIVAGSNCGKLFTSIDGGANWTEHTAMNGCWLGSAVSSSGENMYAGQDLGDIWASSDFGVNFENRTGDVWYYRVRSAKPDGTFAISDEYTLRFQTTSSCPFIFTNDGSKYNFVIDASSSGTMGQGLDLDLWKANPFFKAPSYPNPESFVKIPHGKLVPITSGNNTYYDIKTTFELNEVNYYDQAALEVIDHSPSVDVFPDHRNNNQIHTIAKNAPAPVWIKDARDNDVKSLIENNDDIYWHSSKLDDPSYLTMKLSDDATTPAHLKIVMKKAKEGLFQGNKQSDLFQYKNSSGVFANVPNNLNPYTGKRTGTATTNRILTNNYGTDTKVVDLSGLTIKDNEIRFVVTNRQLQTDIDWIAVDTSADEAVTITKLSPTYADLHSRGVSAKVPTNPTDPRMAKLLEPDYNQVEKTIGMGNPLTGNATRYGDIKELLASADDKYAILVQGDEISLRYAVPAQAGGTERDFIYDTWDYHKSSHNALGDTITPLPFNAMTNYPYHENVEQYPTDLDHQTYQSDYNTREINWGTQQVAQVHHSLNTDRISLAVSASTEDSDGISPSIENAAPNSGDGNGDSVPDAQQSNVTSLVNSEVSGDAYMTLKVDDATCPSLSSVAVSAAPADSGYTYPVGLINFDATCTSGASTTVTLYYDKQYTTSNWVARKYSNGSYTTISGAVFGTALVGSTTVTTLTYTLTDGGSLDSDGLVNGTILDPVGPGVPVTQSSGGGRGFPVSFLQNSPAPAVDTQSKTATTDSSSISSAGLPSGFQFTRDLKQNVTANDVKQLQIFLNANGFVVATKGAGSKGNENTHFGAKTKLQLIKFQEAHAKDILTPQGLKKGTGILGRYTRKVLNAWLTNGSR